MENQYATADPALVTQMSAWLAIAYVRHGWVSQPGDGSSAPASCRSAYLPELDFNGSGEVTVGDIARVALHWGDTLQTPGWDPRYDLDNNGAVDVVDITIIAERWGEICSAGP